jgi:hypothetical protein
MAYDAADGYTVLFGGTVGTYKQGVYVVDNCTGQTWIFKAGEWTDLDIPGPPASCNPSVVYDSSDGYVLEYGGTVDVGSPSQYPSNQTWIFTRGSWTELNILNPSIYGATAGLSDDPALHGVLLIGPHVNSTTPTLVMVAETWLFTNGDWSMLHPATVPTGAAYCGCLLDGTYDAADGYPVFMDTSATWAFVNGDWKPVSHLPYTYDGLAATAYDPKIGYTVLFGEIGVFAGPPYWINGTWLYLSGIWTNASVPGPPLLDDQSIAFDAADGYVVMFGGIGPGPNQCLAACLLNTTWIYSPQPVDLQVSLTASPSIICSTESENCGAGTDTTRVSISVNVVAPDSNITPGTDSGNGVVYWGPYYWPSQPELAYVDWGSIVPSSTLDASASCSIPSGLPAICPGSPVESSVGKSSELLEWSWNATGVADQLLIGDNWTISFNLQAIGPPYAQVPVDSCSTGVCSTDGSSTIDGMITSVSISPSGNDSRVVDSAPLGTVTVLPPFTQTGLPSSSPTPPPPPSVGNPLPSPTPTPANPTPTPSPTSPAAAVGAIVSGLSVSSIGAGVVAAGVTRAALSRTGHRSRVAVRAASKKAGSRDRLRGDD